MVQTCNQRCFHFPVLPWVIFLFFILQVGIY
uniref:Uncharacterized protein n=1 Tax=Anguilla anguilla TaxID=7936 RepID=A0A0E9VFL0_ANGAN